MAELCGKPTKSGKPCNMPKGHDAEFHRHREYPEKVVWSIMSRNRKAIETGKGRVELGYAITKHLKTHESINITISRVK